MAQQRQSPTRSGLLPEARHLVLPKGIATSGFPAVEATCRQLGLIFDPWQVDLNRCILAKGTDGLYAADVVAISIPRQVGKTWDIGAVAFAMCIINPGITVVWTAHRFKVARETFNSLKGIAFKPALAPHIDVEDITTAAGNECIPFRNGSRIVFAARERGAVRGFAVVEILVLDEGQILTESALADLAPTTNQAKNPLIIVMGTPPKPTDPSEVFKRLRTEALLSESDDVLFVEFSAPRGSAPDDREAWRVANPSYPKRTTAKAILRLKKLLSAADFLREALGIWDDDLKTNFFAPANWDDGVTDRKPGLIGVTFGVARSIDQAWVSIGAATPAEDGRWHLGPVARRRGSDWLVDVVKELHAEHPGSRFVIAGTGPASALKDDLLKALGEKYLIVASGPDLCDACADVYDRVQEKRIEHRAYPELDEAVSDAERRPVGDRWAIGRKNSDVSMFESVTLALWGANQPEEPEMEPFVAWM